MSLEDARRGTGVGDDRTSASTPPLDVSPPLTPAEMTVLDLLVSSSTGRTAAQLSASSGLPREQVAAALATLRERGLIARHNTLIESYAARFPGLEI